MLLGKVPSTVLRIEITHADYRIFVDQIQVPIQVKADIFGLDCSMHSVIATVSALS